MTKSKVESSMLQMIADLQSGHIEEGVDRAHMLLKDLQNLYTHDSLAYVHSFSSFCILILHRLINKTQTIIMLGGSCRLLHLAGNTTMALQIFEFVKMLCHKMEPDYNHVSLLTSIF
jgi:hypothetical protein